MSAGCLSRNRYLGAQILCLVLLCLFAGTIYYTQMAPKGLLANDNYCFHNFYVSQWYSLNQFQQIAWWDPNFHEGNPLYFPAISGTSQLQPAFLGFCTIFYFLGLLGFQIKDFYHIYVGYFTFVMPLVFSLSAFAFARQVLRSVLSVFFVVSLLPFSPGVLQNLTDLAIAPEQASSSFLFLAAFLFLLRKQSRLGFALFSLSGATLALSVSYSILHWTLLFIPLFLLCRFAFDRERFQTQITDTARAFPPYLWVGLSLIWVMCALPAVITFLQCKPFMVTKTGGLGYALDNLKSGNPLEILWSAVPGVGVEWTNYRRGIWRLFLVNEPRYVGYAYAGLFTLPLAFIGFVAGPPRLRIQLLAILAAGSLILILCGSSPIIVFLMKSLPWLQIENHLSDATFRTGLFFVLFLAASLGFERLIHSRESRPYFLVLSGMTGAFALLILAALNTADLLRFFCLPMTGFTVILTLVALILVFSMMRLGPHWRKSHAAILLFLFFVDSATVTFVFIRGNLIPQAFPAQSQLKPLRVGVGISGSQKPFETKELRINGAEKIPYGLPEWWASDRLVTYAISAQRPDLLHGIWTSDRNRWLDSVAAVLAQQPGPDSLHVAFKPVSRSFNSMEFAVTASGRAVVVWRDRWFPGWRAQVNGKPVPIIKAFDSLKGVFVNPGMSTVRFAFRPPWVPCLLTIAGLLIFSLAAWCSVEAVRSCRWNGISIRAKR